MYFMLTAIAGLVYRTKHSQRKDVQTLFEANSAGRAHAWLLGLALVRNILDYVWMPYYRSLLVWSLALFNTTVYIYMLYLVIPAIAGAVHARLFSRRVDAVPLLRDSLTVWLVYPMVSLISMIAKSPPRQTIDWFRYIPTFMVEDNFLPAGMLAVVPILAAAYTVLLMRHSRSNWLKSLVSVSLALLAVYLVYYQYTFRFFWEFFRTYGRFVAIGYYTLCFLAPMFLIAGRFERAFGKHSVGFTTLLLLSTLISCGLIVLGLLPS
jgi:hypothetical protein